MNKSKRELETIGIRTSYNGGARLILIDGSEWHSVGNGMYVPFD